MWRSLNALTLVTCDMALSCRFYQALGLKCSFGGPEEPFSTFSAEVPVTPDNNTLHINLFVDETYVPLTGSAWNKWGRCIIYVDDVDEMHQRVIAAGYTPEALPRDAVWGERYFHLRDPMGHELSFAKPLLDHPRWQMELPASKL
eukprot:m.16479 g.16479  ORF g.16479 m.16479 type:complete len:145 (-) comp11062_c0_seq1:111-545(-)